MTVHPRKLLLIDGLGALLSAFLLGIVLVRLESVFGMPRKVLYFLAPIACVLAAYSLSGYFLIQKAWKAGLRVIAFSNLAYCCLTIGFLIYFKKGLTTLGLGYFLAEVTVIITLATFELRAASRPAATNGL